MSTETDRLEREAELHRNRLDSTLAQIESKFSAGAIVDELSGYLRDGQGATMMRNFKGQVRDNPLALGVIGAGVAWLLMGRGARQSASNMRERYRDWREHDEQEHPEQRQYYTPRYDERDPPRRMDLEEDRGMSEGGNGETDYPEYGDGISSGRSSDRNAADLGNGESPEHSTLHDARDRVSDLASDARHTLHDARDKISDATHSAGEWSRDRLHKTGQAGQRVMGAARRSGRYVGHEGRRLAREGTNQVLTAMREQPLVVGAVLIAIGAAIGAALPSSRKEDELMGKTRDRLRGKATEFGEDVVHRAGHVAKTAMRAADEKAGEVGLKPEGGQTLAEKVSSVAGAAVDAGKEDAEKQGLL
ncbi:MAG: hypothetical protein K0S54_1327 [Alphaproteobacteria bacterium]|jgi:hypothetical protein|nr:hypothetical protein [Alphaproteobacteria bacterium]